MLYLLGYCCMPLILHCVNLTLRIYLRYGARVMTFMLVAVSGLHIYIYISSVCCKYLYMNYQCTRLWYSTFVSLIGDVSLQQTTWYIINGKCLIFVKSWLKNSNYQVYVECNRAFVTVECICEDVWLDGNNQICLCYDPFGVFSFFYVMELCFMQWSCYDIWRVYDYVTVVIAKEFTVLCNMS